MCGKKSWLKTKWKLEEIIHIIGWTGKKSGWVKTYDPESGTEKGRDPLWEWVDYWIPVLGFYTGEMNLLSGWSRLGTTGCRKPGLCSPGREQGEDTGWTVRSTAIVVAEFPRWGTLQYCSAPPGSMMDLELQKTGEKFPHSGTQNGSWSWRKEAFAQAAHQKSLPSHSHAPCMRRDSHKPHPPTEAPQQSRGSRSQQQLSAMRDKGDLHQRRYLSS